MYVNFRNVKKGKLWMNKWKKILLMRITLQQVLGTACLLPFILLCVTAVYLLCIFFKDIITSRTIWTAVLVMCIAMGICYIIKILWDKGIKFLN